MKTRRVLAMAASAMLIVFGFTLVAKALVSPSPSTALMFTFYDDGQDGFGSDHIHIFCPSCTGTATVNINFNLTTEAFNIPQGGEAVVEFPGEKGGPVFLFSAQPIVASQRVFYFNSFAEWYAVPISQADTSLMLNWYDHATSGYVDHIHLANPNDNSVNATVQVGSHHTTVTIPGDEATFVDFPGVRGGPVFITASSPILASSRTQFEQSFNEVNAVPVGANNAAGTTLEMNWYDETESFSLDNVHLGNTTGTVLTAEVTAGTVCSKSTLMPVLGEVVIGCGSVRGGPVLVNASGPIIASQRVLFSNSFSEVYAVPVPTPPNNTQLALSWVDLVSSGFSNDNIHIYNSSTSQQTVNVNIGNPSGVCSPSATCQNFTVAPFQEIVTSFPGQRGGPVYITGSVGGLLVSARTKYNSSFNEVNAAVIH